MWYYRHFYFTIFYWTTSTNMVKFVGLVLTNILYIVSEMHLSKYFFVEIVVPNTFVKWRIENVSSKSGLFKLLNSCFIYETFMWRLIYLNQHLKSAFTSISWSRKKNLPHANYVFTLVHPSGTNLYILYIIPSYCENESIANVSCATTTCIVQIFITNWIILSRVMSNIFLKLQ